MPAILDSTFPYGNQSTLPKQQDSDLLFLNDVLKESLKKAQERVRNMQLIIRCENLPRITANRDEVIKLFDDLLGMILNYAP